jgi:RecA/RadA recombinase
MPTFHSIPLHPTIQQRLRDARPVPIATPHAILTRTPHALAEALFPAASSSASSSNAMSELFLSPQINALRCQVALAMIQQQTTTTSRQQRASRKRKRPLVHVPLDENRRTEDDAEEEDEDDSSSGTKPKASTRKPSWSAIPGVTLSAWDQHQIVSQDSTITATTTTSGLWTGCPALDRLLEFPREWQQQQPQQQQPQMNSSSTTTSTTTRRGTTNGIPRGHVLSLVGPSASGKTQLALQLALQAAAAAEVGGNRTPIVRYLASSAGQGGTLVDLALRCQSLMSASSSTSTGNAVATTHHHHHHKTKRGRHRTSTKAAVENTLPSSLYFQPVATTSDLALTLSQIEQERCDDDDDDDDESQNSTCMIVVDSPFSLVAHSDDPEASLERLLDWLKRLARLQHLWVVVVVGMGTNSSISTKNTTTSSRMRLLQHYSDIQLSLQLLSSPSTTTTGSSSRSSVKIQCTKHLGRQVLEGVVGESGGSMLSLELTTRGLQEEEKEESSITTSCAGGTTTTSFTTTAATGTATATASTKQ